MQASQVRSLTCLVCRTHHRAVQTTRQSPIIRHASSEASRQAMIDKIIRVDHAGEVGADRIYAGQMAVLGKTSVGPIIQEMWDQEKHHRATFERLIPEHRVRPTALLPIWNIAGFALGAGTALLGKEGAMACTVAVEESIGGHYNSQIRELLEDDPEKHAELLKIIKQFRDEELEHLDTGLEHDAEQAPMYSALSTVIKTGCSAAIWLSERI
ncbi:5-demethoxyubiquinone hydroxylase, mitochondrial-like [Patiria miniata]|uniref:5-demethoxyubiquinone hydroxylase, mitochondrial n=1 Tax=Patiria miniata TaxID=46514 RepID=A0A914ALD5_PATMI|nr:5-demethoxyubiquinone hydroxylase, mitochondrial-like [Patiria miniata]XP_038064244.1 5-demethoxyubiquinone hydroxylase, mitochondrial-like [Patiria miniata]